MNYKNQNFGSNQTDLQALICPQNAIPGEDPQVSLRTDQARNLHNPQAVVIKHEQFTTEELYNYDRSFINFSDDASEIDFEDKDETMICTFTV